MFSRRALEMEPFQVMEILARAQEMEKAGEDVVHLEIGEPDFPTPPEVIEAAHDAMKAGETHYTDSRGIPELRGAIAEQLKEATGTDVDPDKEVLVTGGVSQALQFVLASLLDPGDEILIQDPGYPCYPNFIRFFDGLPVPLPSDEGYHLNLDALQERVTKRTRAILITTPNNPTGTYFSERELRDLAGVATDHNAWLISDEIYSGLTYDAPRSPSVLETRCECHAVMDGFSKLYAMTGWRLGYVTGPADLMDKVLKLQQNFFISPSSFAQKAAITALAGKDRVREMKREFDRRRKFVFKRVNEIPGMRVEEPRAAYYIFPDVREISDDSTALANRILEKGKVALTPGIAFGTNGEGHLRISYANSMERLEEGMDRIEKVVKEGSFA